MIPSPNKSNSFASQKQVSEHTPLATKNLHFLKKVNLGLCWTGKQNIENAQKCTWLNSDLKFVPTAGGCVNFFQLCNFLQKTIIFGTKFV